MLWLLVLLPFMASAQMLFEASNSTTGTIFEHIHNVTFIEEYRYIQFTSDLNPAIAEVGILRDSVEIIDDICSRLDRDRNCVYFKSFIESCIDRIRLKYTNIALMNYRAKRYFGESTTALLSQLYQLYEYVTRPTNSIREGLMEQNKLINSSIQITRESLSKHARVIKAMGEEIRKLQKEQKLRSIKSFLSDFIQLTILSIFEHTQISENIMAILKYGSGDNIVETLGFEKVRQSLMAVNETIGKNMSLALQSDLSNPYKIFAASEVYSHVENHILTIRIKIPVTGETHRLHKLYKIPVMGKGEMLIIKNVRSYFLEFSDNQLISLSGDELNTCKRMGSKNLICPYPHEFFQIKCENELFYNHGFEHCEFEPVIPQNYLIRIRDDAFYCVTISPHQVMFITREKIIKELNMRDSGWLTFEANGALWIDNRSYPVNIICEHEDCRNSFDFNILNFHMPTLNISEATLPENIVNSAYVIEYDDEQYRLLTEQVNGVYHKLSQIIDLTLWDYLYFFIAIVIILIVARCIIKVVF